MTRYHVIEISTEVFRLLQQRASWLVEWAEQKPGSTQKIVLPDDLYIELIDRAIAHRQSLDAVVRATCAESRHPARASGNSGGNFTQIKRAN